MPVDLVIKNYRCFPDSDPARLTLGEGFTAFVGPNNSGKSTLLKFFFEFRGLFEVLSRFSNELQAALRAQTAGFGLAGVLDTTEVFSNENTRNLQLELTVRHGVGGDALTKMVVEVIRPQSVFRVIEFRTTAATVAPHNGNGYQSDGDEWWLIGPGGARIAYLSPFLKGLRPLVSTLYLGAFRNAINVGGTQNYFDIPVGQQFLQAWKNLKGGAAKSAANVVVRLTDEIRHIFGFDRLEINTSADDSTLQVFVDGRAFRLDELGSGLAQFILVLAAVATREQNYILIDEPELNLHPSLQIDFLTTIASYAKEGVLFGTHTFGLARAVGQSIYTLRRLREGVSQLRVLERTPRLPAFLGELSFSGYQELGFEKVLLVEGPTDVTTIQQFLRKRNLDHKVVLIPLGGSAMINGGRDVELAELKRISQDVHVLIDSERTAAGDTLSDDRQAFIASCQALNIHRHVLDRRAIENYLSDRAVKAVKGQTYRALGPHERLETMNPSWGKQDNWRIAREMTLAELAGTDLGAFIQAL